MIRGGTILLGLAFALAMTARITNAADEKDEGRADPGSENENGMQNALAGR